MLSTAAANTGWIWSPRSTSSSKTRPTALHISSLEFYSLLCSNIYPPVAGHVSHNGCRRAKTKPSTANKLYICQKTDHLSLSTTIFCRCQQTSSVAVNKLFNRRRCLKQFNSNKPSLQNDLNEAKKCFKGNYKPTMYFVLYIVYCVSQYCVVLTIKCKLFKYNLIFLS